MVLDPSKLLGLEKYENKSQASKNSRKGKMKIRGKKPVMNRADSKLSKVSRNDRRPSVMSVASNQSRSPLPSTMGNAKMHIVQEDANEEAESPERRRANFRR